MRFSRASLEVGDTYIDPLDNVYTVIIIRTDWLNVLITLECFALRFTLS